MLTIETDSTRNASLGGTSPPTVPIATMSPLPNGFPRLLQMRSALLADSSPLSPGFAPKVGEPAATQLGARPGGRTALLAPSPDGGGVRVDHRYTAVPTRRVPDSSRSMAAPTVLER